MVDGQSGDRRSTHIWSEPQIQSVPPCSDRHWAVEVQVAFVVAVCGTHPPWTQENEPNFAQSWLTTHCESPRSTSAEHALTTSHAMASPTHANPSAPLRIALKPYPGQRAPSTSVSFA